MQCKQGWARSARRFLHTVCAETTRVHRHLQVQRLSSTVWRKGWHHRLGMSFFPKKIIFVSRLLFFCFLISLVFPVFHYNIQQNIFFQTSPVARMSHTWDRATTCYSPMGKWNNENAESPTQKHKKVSSLFLLCCLCSYFLFFLLFFINSALF